MVAVLNHVLYVLLLSVSADAAETLRGGKKNHETPITDIFSTGIVSSDVDESDLKSATIDHSGSRLRYVRKLNHISREGPFSQVIEKSVLKTVKVESYQYAYTKNYMETQFSMINNVSIKGVVKALGIVGKNQLEFSRLYQKSVETGKEIRFYHEEIDNDHEETSYVVKEDEWLLTYQIVDVYCFSAYGGERQYAYIPHGHIVIRPMNRADLKELSESAIMDDSWAPVTLHQNIQIHDINPLLSNLTPIQINSIGTIALESRQYPGQYLDSGGNYAYPKAQNFREDNYRQWIVRYEDGWMSFESKQHVNHYLDAGGSRYAHTSYGDRNNSYKQWRFVYLQEGFVGIESKYHIYSFLDAGNHGYAWTHKSRPETSYYRQWKIIPLE